MIHKTRQKFCTILFRSLPTLTKPSVTSFILRWLRSLSLTHRTQSRITEKNSLQKVEFVVDADGSLFCLNQETRKGSTRSWMPAISMQTSLFSTVGFKENLMMSLFCFPSASCQLRISSCIIVDPDDACGIRSLASIAPQNNSDLNPATHRPPIPFTDNFKNLSSNASSKGQSWNSDWVVDHSKESLYCLECVFLSCISKMK